MWNCPSCGCQAIAPDLSFCPHCHGGIDEVGKINALTGGTVYEPGDPDEVEDTPSDVVDEGTAERVDPNQLTLPTTVTSTSTPVAKLPPVVAE